MSDQMKAPVAIAAGADDRHRIVHQPLDVIIRRLVWIRPRARRITALARRDGAIASLRQRFDLRVPAMHRFRKAMQQQHQWRAWSAGREGIEGQGGGGGDFGEGGHGDDFRCELVHTDLWCGRWDSNPHDVAIEGF